MLKYIRMMAAALVVFSSACATAPPEGTRPEPPAGEEPRPDQPEEIRREAPLRIGLIVSSTGSSVLEQYADLVMEGVRVAEDAASTPRRDVEVVVRDDGGTTAGAERAVRELEQAGVRVIVGPLVDEALIAAARARSSDDVVIISPTAVSDPFGVRNAYALNVVDTRGAEALGDYGRRWSHVGVLYSRAPESSRQARAFIDAYSRGGRGAVTEAPFASGATNVTAQLTQLREAGVEALYFPASEREIQSILPQLEYAGLDGVQMLGNESWVGDAARRAPPRVLQGAIIATPLLQESSDVAWLEFVSRYENMHRRSLTNPVPALGYDAAVLALQALTSGNSTVRDFRGATGVLSLQSGTVTRRPFLVRIDGGRLIPIN
ncbi:MAG TPA: penicillin-binding protein activator [Longimicrobiales bacterium]|nr:penicillin-binding protein activator [Longimicrobiales bacterium]